MIVEPIAVELSGVPDTLLRNLGRRAAATRIGALEDPVANGVVDRLHYDFANFARGSRLHAVRVGTFDEAVRRFLGAYPAGTVVALGEGLETQFDGEAPWSRAGPRSATAPDRCPPARTQVYGLIAGIAERLPGSLLVFDVVPEAMLDMVRRTSGRKRDLAVELWTWLFNPRERAAISAIPGVEELRDLAPPLKRDIASLGIAAIARLPQRMRYSLPVVHVLQAGFRTVSVH